MLNFHDFKVKSAPNSVYYIKNFINDEEEELLKTEIYNAPKPKWTNLSNRRLQNWGGLPNLKGMITEVIPDWLAKYCKKISDLGVFGEENGANHVLINEYLPNQGIMPHVDGPMYYPTVSTISIGSHTLLDFYRPLNTNDEESKEDDRYAFSLLIEPKSLLILQDDMYKIYLHGIRELKEDIIKDKTNSILNYELLNDDFKSKDVCERNTRISLTIRFVPKTLKLNSSNLFTKKKI